MIAGALRRGRSSGELFLVYDPRENTERLVTAREVARGIYYSSSTRDIIFVPAGVQKTRLVLKSGKPVEAYRAVRVGGIAGWIDPVKSIIIRAGVEEYRAGSVSDLIYYMYRKGLVTKDFEIAPGISVSLVMDGREAALAAAELYDIVAEEGISSAAALTGKLRDFKEYVRLKMEIESAEVRKHLSKATAIAIILFVIGIIAVLLGGGH